MDISVLTAGGSGTVLAANGKTDIAISIDVDIGTGRLSTAAEGGTAGGGFVLSSARTIVANIQAGTSACIVTSGTGYTASITGNVTGGTGGSSAHGVRVASAMTLNVTGNVAGGGSSSRHGIYISDAGAVVSVTGNVSGGSSGTDANGIKNDSSANLTVSNGNLIFTASGSAVTGACLYNPGSSNYVQFAKTGGGSNKFGIEPSAGDLRYGVTCGSTTGTLTLPPTRKVCRGVAYGAGGTETAGTLSPNKLGGKQ